MARKKVEAENIECINKHSCIFKDTDQQRLLVDLKNDHEDFRSAIKEFTITSADIACNTKELATILKDFREDSKEHLKMVSELHKTNQENIKLIATRKTVPVSIFILITATLCGLLAATEVKYSGVNIDISWDGIKIEKVK